MFVKFVSAFCDDEVFCVNTDHVLNFKRSDNNSAFTVIYMDNGKAIVVFDSFEVVYRKLNENKKEDNNYGNSGATGAP